MAHFEGLLKNKKPNTGIKLQGSKGSGLLASISGKNVGIEVVAKFNNETEQDEFMIYRLGGKYKIENSKVIAIIKDNEE